ncbi:hypothetical protein C0Q70_08356 [Pomacea canaliculata]|uniref:VWFA domain-containing protein n=1 Tax=Pomacea canaliculata TaxID=400727 RepID=A0A2T7PHL3_POMCA|nr:hypothetical protein C0Q70_08356 [Pomacea canaliculata]
MGKEDSYVICKPQGASSCSRILRGNAKHSGKDIHMKDVETIVRMTDVITTRQHGGVSACDDFVLVMDGSDSVRSWEGVMRDYMAVTSLRFQNVDNSIGVIVFGTNVTAQSSDTMLPLLKNKVRLAEMIENKLRFPHSGGTGTTAAIQRRSVAKQHLQHTPQDHHHRHRRPRPQPHQRTHSFVTPSCSYPLVYDSFTSSCRKCLGSVLCVKARKRERERRARKKKKEEQSAPQCATYVPCASGQSFNDTSCQCNALAVSRRVLSRGFEQSTLALVVEEQCCLTYRDAVHHKSTIPFQDYVDACSTLRLVYLPSDWTPQPAHVFAPFPLHRVSLLSNSTVLTVLVTVQFRAVLLVRSLTVRTVNATSVHLRAVLMTRPGTPRLANAWDVQFRAVLLVRSWTVVYAAASSAKQGLVLKDKDKTQTTVCVKCVQSRAVLLVKDGTLKTASVNYHRQKDRHEKENKRKDRMHAHILLLLILSKVQLYHLQLRPSMYPTTGLQFEQDYVVRHVFHCCGHSLLFAECRTPMFLDPTTSTCRKMPHYYVLGPNYINMSMRLSSVLRPNHINMSMYLTFIKVFESSLSAGQLTPTCNPPLVYNNSSRACEPCLPPLTYDYVSRSCRKEISSSLTHTVNLCRLKSQSAGRQCGVTPVVTLMRLGVHAFFADLCMISTVSTALDEVSHHHQESAVTASMASQEPSATFVTLGFSDVKTVVHPPSPQ